MKYNASGLPRAMCFHFAQWYQCSQYFQPAQWFGIFSDPTGLGDISILSLFSTSVFSVTSVVSVLSVIPMF